MRLMNDKALHRERSADKEEISIHLDSELLDQIKHLTNDPSKVIETAIRQWLRGERERDDELTRTLERNPPVPLRGEWNDRDKTGKGVLFETLPKVPTILGGIYG